MRIGLQTKVQQGFKVSNNDLDERLQKRAEKMLEKWKQKPGVGFPEIFDKESELIAAYRFFQNPKIEFSTLLEAHAETTKERCKEYKEVLVIEDTTEFRFGGIERREGLGRINTRDQGFLSHMALAVSADDNRIPLGVVAVENYTRSEEKKTKDSHNRRAKKDCESHRWSRVAHEVEDNFQGVVDVIHVMDREGDIYDVLADPVNKDRRFVIRAAKNRNIESDNAENKKLYDALERIPILYQEIVRVSFRGEIGQPEKIKRHPPRGERMAELSMAATAVTMKRTRNSSMLYPKTTTVNVIHVFEECPPDDEPAIEWILLTKEPIDTIENIKRIIAIYRTRWLIEEFFKAIKTGCSFEQRQLTTYHSLKNALAMLIPIAWEMLLLRTQSHQSEEILADGYIHPLRMEVIKAVCKRYPPPDNPTLKDIFFAIAGLGGFLKRNGLPGWLTLKRGYEKLIECEKIWILARKKCVQS